MGAGILPVAKIKNKLYFLFAVEVSDNKWSDFGGKSEKNETTYNTAIREGYEETFFFNNNSKFMNDNFKHLINKNGFFEKKMVSWFSIEEIKNKKHIFRHFYREIVDLILDNEENIKNRIVKI